MDSASSGPTVIQAADTWPIRLQPNPGHEAVQVIQPQAQPVVITVFDAWGRQVWSGQSHRRSTRLDAAAWPVGWYLVRVEGRAGQRTLRWWKR